MSQKLYNLTYFSVSFPIASILHGVEPWGMLHVTSDSWEMLEESFVRYTE